MDNYGVSGGKQASIDGNRIGQTPLETLSDHANTAGRIADLIDQFLSRFNNVEDCEGENGEGLRAVDTSHSAKLARLEQNLARAEELARQLAHIG